MIATDLDGTFLSPDGSVSDINRLAVRRAQEAGVDVVFATGRPPTWLGAICSLGSHTVVASNGAVLLDVPAQEVIASWPVDGAGCLDLAARLRAAMPGVAFGVQQAFAFGYEPSYFYEPPTSLSGQWFSGELADLVAAGPFVKFLAYHRDLSASQMATIAEPLCHDVVTCTYSTAWDFGLLEFSAPGVTKAHTLAIVARQRGISPQDVAVFGDMPNDRDMLEWAGRPYIMGDAHPSLDHLGACRISTNAEDAVGRTILGWFE